MFRSLGRKAADQAYERLRSSEEAFAEFTDGRRHGGILTAAARPPPS